VDFSNFLDVGTGNGVSGGAQRFILTFVKTGSGGVVNNEREHNER
jgi:hypothetical protein